MTTYVLVPGAWLDGWAWRPVADRLRADGHQVHAVTLTGLGDRSHQATPEVDLDTYVSDVVDLVEAEDLHDVVLVGHSYAGHVVTGVADRIPDRIALLAYLDAGPSPDGAAFIDLQPPPARELIERLVAEAGDGWRSRCRRGRSWRASWGRAWRGSARRSAPACGPARPPSRSAPGPSPCPWGTRPVEELPKLLITCSIPLAQVREMIDSGHPWFAALAGPSWSFLELPTGHWPMFSVPDGWPRRSAA